MVISLNSSLSYVSFAAIVSRLALSKVSEHFTFWISSFKAIAASDESSELARPEGSEENLLQDDFGIELDGFWDETNNGLAAGSMSWSKALKLAHPESLVAMVAFDSAKPLKINYIRYKTTPGLQFYLYL